MILNTITIILKKVEENLSKFLEELRRYLLNTTKDLIKQFRQNRIKNKIQQLLEIQSQTLSLISEKENPKNRKKEETTPVIIQTKPEEEVLFIQYKTLYKIKYFNIEYQIYKNKAINLHLKQ